MRKTGGRIQKMNEKQIIVRCLVNNYIFTARRKFLFHFVLNQVRSESISLASLKYITKSNQHNCHITKRKSRTSYILQSDFQ